MNFSTSYAMIRRRVLFLLLGLNLIVVCFFVYNLSTGLANKSLSSQHVDGEEKEAVDVDPLKDIQEANELCVIVPYRDRLEELQEFAPYIHEFLSRQGVQHQILVMNQTDELRFNRASLINVGWLEARRLGCSYIVMHDVDLLPVNPNIDYGYPGQGVVRHISSPKYHPKYNYTKFIGGILMLTSEDYLKLDGMSNKYWGWGLEDDEFYLRIRDVKLNLTRVSGLDTDQRNTFRHIHPKTRKRDYAVVTKDQREMKRKRDRISGLHNVDYEISSRRLVNFGPAKTHVINVILKCHMKWTPYCVLNRH